MRQEEFEAIQSAKVAKAKKKNRQCPFCGKKGHQTTRSHACDKHQITQPATQAQVEALNGEQQASLDTLGFTYDQGSEAAAILDYIDNIEKEIEGNLTLDDAPDSGEEECAMTTGDK